LLLEHTVIDPLPCRRTPSPEEVTTRAWETDLAKGRHTG
jgi:hypothetical protein